MEKFKLLWMSDSPLMPTGYANQTRNILKRLARNPNWEVNAFGWGYTGYPRFINEDDSLGKTPTEGSYKLFPGGGKPFGEDLLVPHLNSVKPDIFAALCDTFMIHYVTKLDLAPSKFLMYFPSDGVPLPITGYEVLKKANTVVAMSKFGQAQAIDLGIDAKYIPHGTESQVFYEYNEKTKAFLRDKWSKRLRIDLKDKFVVGTVARNQGRKNYPELLKAFGKFAEGKNDVVFLLHCDPNDPANPGHDFYNLLRRYNIDYKTAFTGMRVWDGLSETELREIYNLFDVHALATSGEGWGIPTVEAMMCGVPNVITDFTTTKELVVDSNSGIAVPLYCTITGTYNVERAFVNTEKFAEALNVLYEDRKKTRQLGQNGKNFAVQNFDFDKVVFPKWTQLLEEMVK